MTSYWNDSTALPSEALDYFYAEVPYNKRIKQNASSMLLTLQIPHADLTKHNLTIGEAVLCRKLTYQKCVRFETLFTVSAESEQCKTLIKMVDRLAARFIVHVCYMH